MTAKTSPLGWGNKQDQYWTATTTYKPSVSRDNQRPLHAGKPNLEFCCRAAFISFSAVTLLVGRQEGHPAVRKVGCWFVGGWQFDWGFAGLIAPVVIITSISLSSNSIQNEDILVPTNLSQSTWKNGWERERERERERPALGNNMQSHYYKKLSWCWPQARRV